uniref:ParB/RepB/Spo0J family partition protein n=1 Tax=Methylomonas sp. AM2-LC TaxID=3153301 RepID=UPI003267FD08
MAAKAKKTENSISSSLGLEGLDDLSELFKSSTTLNNGEALEIDINLIDEDPDQPRTASNIGFSDESLSDLAKTITDHGVIQPIALRDNPDVSGRYIIIFGARRYRASKIANKTTIPAFIKNNLKRTVQIIENLQREDLSTRETLESIRALLNEGLTKSQISREIGKSPSYVTHYVALLDLPETIKTAFDSNRVTDVKLIGELVKAFNASAEETIKWMGDQSQEITRGTVKHLRDFLDIKKRQEEDEDILNRIVGDDANDNDNIGSLPLPILTSDLAQTSDTYQKGHDPVQTNDIEKIISPPSFEQTAEHHNSDDSVVLPPQKPVKSEENHTDSEKFKKAIVIVEHDGRPARLVLDKRPTFLDGAWLKFEDDGHLFEAPISSVQLVRLIEG